MNKSSKMRLLLSVRVAMKVKMILVPLAAQRSDAQYARKPQTGNGWGKVTASNRERRRRGGRWMDIQIEGERERET